jgi:hypothetical protein
MCFFNKITNNHINCFFLKDTVGMVGDYMFEIGKNKMKINRYKNKWFEMEFEFGGEGGFLNKMPNFNSVCFIGDNENVKKILLKFANKNAEIGNRVLYVGDKKEENKKNICFVDENNIESYKNFDFNVVVFEGDKFDKGIETNFQKKSIIICGIDTEDKKSEICNVACGVEKIAFADYVFLVSEIGKKVFRKFIWGNKLKIKTLRGKEKIKIKI